MTRVPGDLVVKDPESIEWYGFDWTLWLAEIGESVTIQTSTWSVSAASITADDAGIVVGGRMTQVRLSGGQVGARYQLTNHIVATDGSADDRSFLVRVEER